MPRNRSEQTVTNLVLFIYLYIYPPNSQKSGRGAIHRVSYYPDLLPEIPRYCCPVEIRDMTKI